MKLILNGNINKIYVQGLALIFYHGVKFPEGEENTDGITLTVDVSELDNTVTCSATLTDGEREASFIASAISENGESADRVYKIAVGQAVYRVGSELTGKTAGYGILTGIRPSKVAAEIIKSVGTDKAREILVDRYLMSPDKAELCLAVAENETRILSLTDDSKCSVYISIPFCPSRCTYCSFISCATKKLLSLIPEYLDKLCKEIKSTFETARKCDLTVSCVYIGGGTPTILTEKQLERLLSTVWDCVDVSALDEYTLEGGRPDTITDEKLIIAKKYGVSRISVNPQTMNDSILEKIGRKHTVKEFVSAFEKVKASGIPCINTDLIAGLDGDDYESFKRTVDSITDLDPDNVTVHSFCVKNASTVRAEDKDIYEKNDKMAIQSVDYSVKKLLSVGYIPYYMYRQKNTVGNSENVGYAKPHALGLYNVFMMSDAHTVFGVGAGSTTKLVSHSDGEEKIQRIFSSKYPYEYLKDTKDTKELIKEFFRR